MTCPPPPLSAPPCSLNSPHRRPPGGGGPWPARVSGSSSCRRGRLVRACLPPPPLPPGPPGPGRPCRGTGRGGPPVRGGLAGRLWGWLGVPRGAPPCGLATRCSPRREGRGAAAGAAGGRRRVPDGADLLRADDGQHRLPRRGGAAGAAFVDAFAGYDAVVVPSASCAGSVRHQHALVARALGRRGARGRRWREVAPRTYELTEFLVDVLGVADVGASFPHRVTYHPTCHSLRMLGVGDRPLRLLAAVRGIGWSTCRRPRSAAGSAARSRSRTPTPRWRWARTRSHVRETGAEVLVAGDNSCLMHIGGLLSRQRSGVRTMHLAEVLAPPSDRSRPTLPAGPG